MVLRPSLRWLLLVFGLLSASAVAAQVRTGPPPEVRALFDAFTPAMNSGSAATWEAFGKAGFAPALDAVKPGRGYAAALAPGVEGF